jgi:hypothetical protein
MNIDQQRVGESFVLDSMMYARDRTWDVVNQLSSRCDRECSNPKRPPSASA